MRSGLVHWMGFGLPHVLARGLYGDWHGTGSGTPDDIITEGSDPVITELTSDQMITES